MPFLALLAALRGDDFLAEPDLSLSVSSLYCCKRMKRFTHLLMKSQKQGICGRPYTANTG